MTENLKGNNGTYTAPEGDSPDVVNVSTGKNESYRDNRGQQQFRPKAGLNNTVTTSSGNDQVRLESQINANVNTGLGSDTVNVFDTSNATIISGTDINYSVMAKLGRAISGERLDGYQDRDNVNLRESRDVTVKTGRGNDTVNIRNSSGNIDLGRGNDTVNLNDVMGTSIGSRHASSVSINGGEGNDTFKTDERITGREDKNGVTTLHTASGGKIELKGFENIEYNGHSQGPSGVAAGGHAQAKGDKGAGR